MTMPDLELFATRVSAQTGRTTYAPIRPDVRPTEPTVPPSARGAVDTRNAAKAEHEASGGAQYQRERYLEVLLMSEMNAQYDGVSDSEAAVVMDTKPSTVSARRNELTGNTSAAYALRPFVQRVLAWPQDGHKRPCRVTGVRVSAYELTDAGREAAMENARKGEVRP